MTSAEGERLAALAAYDMIGVNADDPVVADLRAMCELAAAMLGVRTAVVNLLDDRFQHQVAAYGVDPRPCERDQSMCQSTLAEGSDICVADASADPRLSASPYVDGRIDSIRLYCAAILRNPAGHALGTLCVFDRSARQVSEDQARSLRLLARQVVDVLELRLRSRQLARTHAELARSHDRLASFAGQISHDLKAPITAILGFTELLSEISAVATDARAAGYVTRCMSATRRMLVMIDDLLAFARVGGTLNPRPIALDTVMPEVLEDLGTARAGATVTWSGPPIVADPAQLRALLQNLVSNSLTFRGERPCEVRVVTERDVGSIVLRVIDNGSGVPAEQRDDVVRPLVRLRKDVAGAGLGLAVCMRIVTAHGGSLELSDTQGGGTTARVILPR